MKKFLCGQRVVFLLVCFAIIAAAEENVTGAEAKGVNWPPIVLAALAVVLMLAKMALEHHIRQDVKGRGINDACWYENRINPENPQQSSIFCARRKKTIELPHVRCNHYSPNKDFLQLAHTHPLYYYVSRIDLLCTGLIAVATILVSL